MKKTRFFIFMLCLFNFSTWLAAQNSPTQNPPNLDIDVMISSGKMGGAIGDKELAACLGLIAKLRGGNSNTRCRVVSYTVSQIFKDSVRATFVNQGGSLNGAALDLIQRVKAGQLIQFTNIMVQLPSENAPRNAGSLSFFVK